MMIYALKILQCLVFLSNQRAARGVVTRAASEAAPCGGAGPAAEEASPAAGSCAVARSPYVRPLGSFLIQLANRPAAETNDIFRAALRLMFETKRTVCI